MPLEENDEWTFTCLDVKGSRICHPEVSPLVCMSLFFKETAGRKSFENPVEVVFCQRHSQGKSIFLG